MKSEEDAEKAKKEKEEKDSEAAAKGETPILEESENKPNTLNGTLLETSNNKNETPKVQKKKEVVEEEENPYY